MTIVRCFLLTLCLSAILAAVAPVIVPAPKVHAQQTTTQQTAPQENAQQAYKLSPEKQAQAIAISRIRNILDIVGGLWGIAVLWLLLSSRTASRLESWTTGLATRRWIQGLLFFALFLLITAIANLPLDWYSHLEERAYSVSVQGWGSWLGDEAKSALLTMVIGSLVMLLFNWIVRRWPRRYWVGIWIVSLPLLIFSIFLSPYLEPLFNKFEPLAQNHAPLVAKLETVVARTGIGIPPERMFLMKASAKSNGLNAYVTGIGSTKRYVMWDTTTDRLPDDEILFVFGHESGHYILNHIPKSIGGTWVGLFFVFLGCATFANTLARRNSSRWGLDTPGSDTPLASRAGFIVLLFSISLAGFVLEPVTNTFSRHFEHQADIYGQEAIHGLVPDPQKTAVSAFNHLGESWLEDPNPSPFIEFWEYNHPSVQTRANFAEHYNPWANGGHGEFFEK